MKRNLGFSVKRALAEFEKAEKSTAHRKGTLKIDVPFEKALDTILKSKSETKKHKEKHLDGLLHAGDQ